MSGFKDYINVYEFDTTLPGNGEVIKFKPITTGQMKKLLVYEGEKRPSKIEEALDNLITTSVVSENFDVTELYLQDRFYLLVELRKKTKGSNYQFDFTCPKCKSQSVQNIDLDNLVITNFDKNFDKKIQINDNVMIELGHLRRKDQIKAFKVVDKLSKLSKLTESQRMAEITIYTYAEAIETIITPDGEEKNVSLKDKVYLLDNIPQDDYTKVTEWFEKNNFGIDFTYTAKCVHCEDFEEKRDIPVSNFFF